MSEKPRPLEEDLDDIESAIKEGIYFVLKIFSIPFIYLICAHTIYYIFFLGSWDLLIWVYLPPIIYVIVVVYLFIIKGRSSRCGKCSSKKLRYDTLNKDIPTHLNFPITERPRQEIQPSNRFTTKR